MHRKHYRVERAMIIFPAGNYMFKVNNRNSGTKCKICSKLTIAQVNAGWIYAHKSFIYACKNNVKCITMTSTTLKCFLLRKWWKLQCWTKYLEIFVISINTGETIFLTITSVLKLLNWLSNNLPFNMIMFVIAVVIS